MNAKSTPRGLSLAVPLALGLVPPACTIEPLGPHTPDVEVHEIHGTPVSDVDPEAAITWSPSGDVIAFVTSGGQYAYAYHPLTRALQQLYRAPPSERLSGASVAGDRGEWFTASMTCCSGGFLRRHTAAGSTLLSDHGGRMRIDPIYGGGFLLAPDGSAVAFLEQDSLFLLPSGGERVLLGAGCEGTEAFAPDGSRVLCTAGFWSSRKLRVFPTDGGSPDSVVLPTGVAESTELVHWGAGGIRVVYSDFTDGSRHRVFDPVSGLSTSFGPIARDPEAIMVGKVAWSADGSTAAYWTQYCAQWEPEGFGCRVLEAFLYVLDTATGAARRIAAHKVGTSDRGYPLVAVSPNGSVVAYEVNASLYLVAVD